MKLSNKTSIDLPNIVYISCGFRFFFPPLMVFNCSTLKIHNQKPTKHEAKKKSHAKTRHCLPRWMVEICSSVLVQTGLKPSSCVCPVVRRKPCKMWCELHAFHHFCFKCSCSFALFLVISWFIQKNFFTPTSKPQSFTLGFQRASYLIWNGPMLRKTSIFLANKQRSTGFDEAPPKIYQRYFHKWYKIHDTLRISRFQNWWCSRSQKNPPKHQSQTPSIGGSNRWLPLDAAPTPLQLARSWTSWTMEVRNKLMTKR